MGGIRLHVSEDEHLLCVVRHVERNPSRAQLVTSCREMALEQLWATVPGTWRARPWLDGPVQPPENWLAWVDQPRRKQNWRRCCTRTATLRVDTCNGRVFGVTIEPPAGRST